MELRTPILIVGGGTGGVAAALAIARAGGTCIVSEPTDWIGGQLTTQAVPPDENRWIEGAEGVQSAPRSYLDFRAAVRQWYRDHRPLTAAARKNPRLNPGNGWVSHLCFEPMIGHEILQTMLAPHIAAGRVKILYHHEPIAADVDRDRIRSVTLRDVRDGNLTTITADYILDATECGDLLPLASAEHSIGAESQSVHNELHARTDKSDPFDQQPISWCFAIEHRPGENHIIDKPANYDFWKNYIPQFDKPWPGKLLSWTVIGGDEHQPKTFRFLPPPDAPAADELDMWRYRRIVDASIYSDPNVRDVALINMVQMDYFQKPTLGVSPEARQLAFAEAKQQSLCFLHWMQADAPRHDSSTKTGYPGLKLRGQELGTTDGFAKSPYIREAARLHARTIVTEAHVGVAQRGSQSAEPFPDSVGIGHYRLDLHPSTAMRNSIYLDALPFRIPMGALIPIRLKNLLAAGKNLGVTHITSGCYRLHPVEWSTGEAASLLALYCLRQNREPHQVHDHPDQIRSVQSILQQQGTPLAWPWE